METRELFSAAAAIAGHLAEPSFTSGNVSPERIKLIAHTAVQIAKEIELEVRYAYSKHPS